MTCTIMKSVKSCLFNAALLAAMSGPAFGIDGVVLIDQNKALAGNVTPGDVPGFPVTITQPGSYRLAGNLTVPNANTNAIVIAASHVTIDLNGFAILGPTDCSGGLEPCAGAGIGSGISTDVVRFNITIRNGTIQGMGTDGIRLDGDSHLVEYMHVRSNGKNGILILESSDGGSSIAQRNTAQRNGDTGITVTRGSVSHNTADVNLNGIVIYVGSMSYNVVTRNRFGITVNLSGGSYFGNVLNGNIVNTQGGVNLGQNLCDNAPCPGAQL